MRKLKNILILAGGDSTRFWPLKKKAYVPFLGKPLLLHQLYSLKEFTERLFVVVNPADVKSINRLNTTKQKIIFQRNDLNGMAGAVLSAKNIVKGPTLILNAEDIFDYNILYRCIDTSIQSNADAIFIAKKVHDYFPGAYVKFIKNKIAEIVEKPDPKNTPSNFVKLVIDYFKDFETFIKTLENTKTAKDDLYEQAINKFLNTSSYCKLIEYENYWYVLKYPWHVLPMMQHYLGTSNSAIKIGKNVKIAETAKIVGPCFIDDNTIVGDFVMIRQSHIGKNCLIGGYSEITRSYLGDRVTLHRNYIGDSVLANDVMFGAQASTANFRFDRNPIKSKVIGEKMDTNLEKLGAIIGESSKIGVNATLLPGVKIGRNTFIGPGETLYEDVEDDMFMIRGKIARNMAR